MQLNLSFPPSFPSNVAWHPPLIRKARTRCDLTGFHLAARSAQVLSLGRLACWRSSRPGARGLSARFHTLSLSRAPRLCPVAVDITMLTRRKRRRCWYVTVPIWKNTGETDTPFLKWSFRGYQHHLTKTQNKSPDELQAIETHSDFVLI